MLNQGTEVPLEVQKGVEECGEIEADEARRWKEGIYGLMVLWGLEPDEVLGPSP